ncbi:hypothetical protein ACSFC1_09550 [Pseudothermotoga sp. U03pept]|uniref:hypothetical protein n=1 Tax=Pseudothermotoga sp. U03pept TaxID=3447012 RepID=UPI003F1052D6
MHFSDEELVKEVKTIEQQIDLLIENQQYEELLPLLERREQILKSFAKIDSHLADEILKADAKRIEKIKSQMQQLSENALQMKKSEAAIKSYKDITQACGTRFDKKM